MERFKDGYSTHGHFRAELFVISFALLVIGLFVYPKVKIVVLDAKLNSAIDSVISYKESVNSFYVSRLLYDSSFKLDGVYKISDGNLVTDSEEYDIHIYGNVPSSGYLLYKDNILKDGCVMINNFSVIVVDGDVSSATQGSCNNEYASNSDVDVAFGM